MAGRDGLWRVLRGVDGNGTLTKEILDGTALEVKGVSTYVLHDEVGFFFYVLVDGKEVTIVAVIRSLLKALTHVVTPWPVSDEIDHLDVYAVGGWMGRRAPRGKRASRSSLISTRTFMEWVS